MRQSALFILCFCACIAVALALSGLGQRAQAQAGPPPSAASVASASATAPTKLWDAIDEEVMVDVKGAFALLAVLVMLSGYIPGFYALRLQPFWIRAVALSAWLLPCASSAWLGGLADTGSLPEPYARAIRAHAPTLYYAGCCVLLLGIFGVWRLFYRNRLPVALGAITGVLVTFGTIACLWAAGIASGDSATAHWAREHGSAAGFYYIAALLFTTAMGRLCVFVYPQGPRLFETALVVGGVFSAFMWWNLGHYHFDHYAQIDDEYPAVMGAKYPELGYSRLYACSAAADAQDGLSERLQAGTNADSLARPALCTDHFTDPQRWEQFRRDNRFFRSQFSRAHWHELQNDHGYHATPAWAIMGRAIVERVPLNHDNLVKLALIDSFALIAMWTVVWWAFGWRACAIALIYWGTNFPARFGAHAGSFLNYDWLVWMIVGVCFLRKQKPFAAGAALGYASLLRVFPGCLVLALVLKAIAGMLRERRFFIAREQRAFAAGCAAALLLLVPLSGWASDGIGSWGAFVLHGAARSAVGGGAMGLPTLHALLPVHVVLVGLFCLLLARASDREQDDWAVACLGTGLIVVATTLPGDDYGFLLAYGLLWDRRRLPGILAAALAAFSCFIHHVLPGADDQFAAVSIASALMVVAITANSAFGKRAVAEPALQPSLPLLAAAPLPRIVHETQTH